MDEDGVTPYYRRAKRDKNHTPIVQALTSIPGLVCVDLCAVGGGVPDLLVVYKGVTVFLEVKSADTAYGKASLAGKVDRAGTHGESIRAQADFKRRWDAAGGCCVVTVTDVQAALACVGVSGGPMDAR